MYSWEKNMLLATHTHKGLVVWKFNTSECNKYKKLKRKQSLKLEILLNSKPDSEKEGISRPYQIVRGDILYRLFNICSNFTKEDFNNRSIWFGYVGNEWIL